MHSLTANHLTAEKCNNQQHAAAVATQQTILKVDKNALANKGKYKCMHEIARILELKLAIL